MSRTTRLNAALDAFARKEAAPSLDARLARALVLAQPGDARVVLERLLDVDTQLRAHEGRLRNALVWPTLTMGLVLVATVLVSVVAGAAFKHLPAGARVSTVTMLAPAVFAAAAMAALVLAASRRWSLGFVTAWRSLDAWVFTTTAVALVRGGTPLPLAVKSAAECCDQAARGAALSLAHGLEAGAPDAAPLQPLLGKLAASLVVTGAPRGTAVTTLDAVSTLTEATVGIEVRRDAERLAGLGLFFGAAALVATGFHFYSAYLMAAGV